ncbi:hypothetical protein Cch01nite_14490 [Cellulomonas chitinilytica]|uniref:Uncharacterized protein n=1 Tax=Cellulomonas chitinilytica TaxID=398759 RepID=A0A919P133_9CELL|nr:DUF6326 family protein [Cellulomonas chitinilytica]GIG20725.1 hypothetical protein Cch01nite_14490 [Cellulomonas chitinilytica]
MTALTAPHPPSATTARVTPRTVVSSLWLFAVLCYLYCDVLGFFAPDDLRAILDGAVGGITLTDGFLLASAVLMTIPMAMVLVSRVAPHRIARWGTVVAGAVMTVVQAGSLLVGTGPRPHYVYFSVIEIATTGFLVGYALTRWRHDD